MPLARTEADQLEIDPPGITPDAASSPGETRFAHTARAADPSALSDSDLLRSVARWAALERRTTAELLRHLAELDLRRLYLGAGCASTFAYCTERLRMSESAAYHRITAARVGRRFPELLERLEASDLHLSGICLLAPVLTETNLTNWIARARGQSKRAIERMLQRERERGSAQSHAPWVDPAGVDFRASTAEEGFLPLVVRRQEDRQIAHTAPVGRVDLEVETDASLSFAPRELPATAVPVRGQRSPAARQDRISLTADAELHDLIDQARDLVRHRNPSGDLTALLRLALRALIATTERRRFGRRPKLESTDVVASVPTVVNAKGTPDAPFEAPAEAPAEAQAGAPAEAPVETPVEANPVLTGAVAAVTTTTAGVKPASWRRRAPRPRARNARVRSRYIPIAVRRTVWERDGARCAFRSSDGHPCDARGFLQFHHLVPFAAGGAHTVENLALRCGPHNRYEAESGSERSGSATGGVWRTGRRAGDADRADEDDRQWDSLTPGRRPPLNSPRGEHAPREV